jgi:hypothetical protein
MCKLKSLFFQQLYSDNVGKKETMQQQHWRSNHKHSHPHSRKHQAVDDVMPQVMWTRYFLEAQGYGVSDCTIYQDNQSAMLLEKNGRKSSSKRTRHIKIKYFFVTDRIKGGEVKVEHCPTDNMPGDPFTKPLQGKKFRGFGTHILNASE